MNRFSSPPKASELKLGWNKFPAEGKPNIGTSKTPLAWMLKIRLGGWAYVYIKSLMKEGVQYAITGLADRQRPEPETNAYPFTKE